MTTKASKSKDSAIMPKKAKKNKKDIVIPIVEYVNEHINEKISVAEIAEELKKNPSYLNAVFKMKVGMCLSEYIQLRKIEEAKKRLKITDISISDIWTALSYYDQSHFIHSFKSKTGMTPLQYRTNYFNLEKEKAKVS